MLTPTNLCEAVPYIVVSCLCTCWKALDSVFLSVRLSLPFSAKTLSPSPAALPGSLGSVMDTGDGTGPVVLSPGPATPPPSSTAYFLPSVISVGAFQSPSASLGPRGDSYAPL